jgi:protein phosphatase
LRFVVSAHSQRGVSREENQDTVTVSSWQNLNRERDSFIGKYSGQDLPQLFMLADGMGGHANGATASQTAVEQINGSFNASPENFDEQLAVENVHRFLVNADGSGTRPMGTTIAGFLINETSALIFNVGDSKIHCIDELNIEELTIEDRDPYQKTKAITQCLGGGITHPTVHSIQRHYKTGHKFILSSDGLTDHISPEQIVSALNDSSGNLATELCAAAKSRGSDDDISAIVVEVQ